MQEHVSDTDVRRYAGKEMSAEELLSFDEHVEGCPACRQLLADYRNVGMSTAALRWELRSAATEPYHLSYEDLESHVEKTADEVEAEIIRDHLDNCVLCSTEAAGLESFRNELTRQESFHPSADESIWKPQGFWVNFASKVRILQVAAVVAVAISSSLFTRWFVRRNYAGLSTKVEALSRENEILRSQAEQSRILSQGLAARLREAQGSEDVATTVELRDGSGIVYDQTGNLTVPASMPAPYKDLMVRTLADANVNLPAWVDTLRGKKGVLMGPSDPAARFKLETPIGSATFSDRPEFRWERLEGATNYVVSVYDENFTQVAASKPITANEWQPEKSLKRGRTYLWQVVATRDGREITAPSPPSPEARFKVIDSARASELESAKRNYPDAHLLLGLLFARAGDTDLARGELQRLRRANPQSHLAERLLKSLDSKIGKDHPGRSGKVRSLHQRSRLNAVDL